MGAMETRRDEEVDVAQRAEELFEQHRLHNAQKTSRVFVWLMLGQWVFAVVIALFVSPYAWAGRTATVHLHLWAALLLGGVLSALPVALAMSRPTATITRHIIAVAQMLWSALLIHLTGGRIETHFHVFGSLAFLAFYRDVWLLPTATVVVAADHLVRGILFPESVYGTPNPEWWRFLEHEFWVVFEGTVLFVACLRGVQEMREVAHEQAAVEAASSRERDKSAALDAALRELERSQDALVRQEKLAAIGELAASVGHELRNPLAAISNANAFIRKKLAKAHVEDARVAQFLGIIDEECAACAKIISDLLEFAREQPLALVACPLAPLAEEAVSLVPTPAEVAVKNAVPEDLPVPTIDKDKFRQVLINLVQNAVEAIPEGRSGEIVISAQGGGDRPFSLSVQDNGVGMAEDVSSKVFQPLFTTKSKGTGLGLAIVANMIRRHAGSIRVDSQPGKGSTFIIELPAKSAVAAA
jgi:signal transduction histidine kinase